MPASLQTTLDFLRDLEANNDREWFNANKARYEAARTAFTDLVSELLGRFDSIDDLGPLDPDQLMWRLNRDVRFSADKSPYKTSMTALFARGGRKTEGGRAYYLEIKPGGQSMLAGGLWFPPSEHLTKVRETIAEDAQPLRDLMAAPDFVRVFGQVKGEMLKTAPKGFPKDHPDIDLLRHKSFEASRLFSDEEVLADDFADKVLDACAALKPFAGYFAEILKDMPPAERH